MYIGIRVKYPLFLSDFNETRIFLTDFRKLLKYKFYENPSSGIRAVPFERAGGRMDRHDEAKSLFAILRTRLKTAGREPCYCHNNTGHKSHRNEPHS
jgi:hypothetical protein